MIHNMRKLLPAFVMAVLGFWALQAQEGGDNIDPALKSYAKTEGVSGNLNSIGSDTLNNLMTYWAEDFRKAYPGVNIQIEGKGSGTAPPALISGTAQLGPMSRTMKAEEIESFEDEHGFKPTAVGVCLDALAVYVHKDNPVASLSLQQVDAIFSRTRKGGHPEDIKTWGQAGVSSMGTTPISLYGRNSASGTYGYFKEHALFKGDYKDTVKEQPGSASVVLGITEDPKGIGYSGLGYRTSGVRMVPLSSKTGEPAVDGSYQNVTSGKYPLARLLYIYVAKKPGEPLPALTREFLRFALSKEGQKTVVKDGYLPLPSNVAEEQLKLIE